MSPESWAVVPTLLLSRIFAKVTGTIYGPSAWNWMVLTLTLSRLLSCWEFQLLVAGTCSRYSNGNHRSHPWLSLLPQFPYFTGPVSAVKTVFLTYLGSYQDGVGFYMMPRASKEKRNICFSFVPFFTSSKNSGISTVQDLSLSLISQYKISPIELLL